MAQRWGKGSTSDALIEEKFGMDKRSHVKFPTVRSANIRTPKFQFCVWAGLAMLPVWKWVCGHMLTGEMLTGQMLTPLSKNRTNAHWRNAHLYVCI